MSFVFNNTTLKIELAKYVRGEPLSPGVSSIINEWDVSQVTNMYALFMDQETFNQDIGNWKTLNVTNMALMFSGARMFNQDIGRWNTSNVTTMASMFMDASMFNQDIGRWNTSKVTNMFQMFRGAQMFDQNIRNWNINGVTTMGFMFYSATNFNNAGVPLDWNIGKKTNTMDMTLHTKLDEQREDGMIIDIVEQLNEIVEESNKSYDEPLPVGEPLDTAGIPTDLETAVEALNASITNENISTISKNTSADHPLPSFTEVPHKNANVFLFVLRHGGYAINPDYTYNVVECPVQHLIRLQYAPYGTCSIFTDKFTGMEKYNNLLQHRLDRSDFGESTILDDIHEIAEQSKGYSDARLDVEHLGLTMGLGTRKIKDHLDEIGTLVETRLGDKMLNKTYYTDLNPIHPRYRFCGIPILYDVTFKLPDIFQHAPQLQELITYLSSNPLPFSIGEYNVDTGEITYRAETELLSCLFFQYFLYLNEVPYHVPNAVSLTKNNNGTYEPRPMVYEISSDMVFRYFQYANMVVLFDYSCSSFVFTEASYKELSRFKSKNFVHDILFTKGLYTRKSNDPKGGKIIKRTNKKRRTVKKKKRQTYKRKRRNQRQRQKQRQTRK
jgi:surface protein